MSSQSMDPVDFVCGHCPVCLDFVQGVHGQCPDCPLSPWTMSTESINNVHWIHGHCPVWLVSMGFVHGLTGLLSRLSTKSIVNDHLVHGKNPGSPLSPWIFYRQDRYYTIYEANKDADQTAGMRRLICIFVVRIWQKQVFSWHGSNDVKTDIKKVDIKVLHQI